MNFLSREVFVKLANITFADVCAVYGRGVNYDDEYLRGKHVKAISNPVGWACELDTGNMQRLIELLSAANIQDLDS